MALSAGRKAWLDREKVNHPSSRTKGELRRLLGISDKTFDRWKASGRIPPASYTSLSGWPLWSAEQVRELVKERVGGTST